MKKRVEWADVLKFLCMMFVMISHWEACPALFFDFFGPFFLTAFFFLSGYCYKPSKDFKSLLYKKFRTLFVPWLFFSYANIFLSRIMSFKEHSGFMHEMIFNALQIRGLDDRLWFIAALFVAFIPFYFVIRKMEEGKNSEKKTFVLLLLSTFVFKAAKLILKAYSFEFIWGNTNLPWHLEYVCEVCLYMYMGYMFKKKYETYFDERNNTVNRLALTVLYLVLVYGFTALNIDLGTVLGNIHSYAVAFMGIALSVSYSKLIKPNWFTRYVGQNTLVIFSTHNKVQTFLEVLLRKLAGPLYKMIISNSLYATLFSFIFFTVTALILYYPVMLINRYCKTILGKQ